MTTSPVWVLFFVVVFLALGLDYWLSSSHSKKPWFSPLALSIYWIILSLGFGVALFYKEPKLLSDYITGYTLEKFLSIDNLLVISYILATFQIPLESQRKVLFWGLLGAITFRLFFIFEGLALIHYFHNILFLFGAFLLFIGLKSLFKKPTTLKAQFTKRWIWMQRFLPMSSSFNGGKFFIREGGKLKVTLLFAALFLIETSDVIFAIDSIPAIFAITENPLIVYTSNIFAVIGLRSFHDLIAPKVSTLPWMQKACSTVLIFVGLKILLDKWISIPSFFFLGLVLLTFLIFFLIFRYQKR